MMQESAAVLTVYDAIWEGLPVASRCHNCGNVACLDPRRLALDGHGRSRLAEVPLACSCGGTGADVLVG